SDFDPWSDGELYDPGLNEWQLLPSAGGSRAHHTATRLPSGDVLVVGGGGPTLFGVATNTWIPLGGPQPSFHTATLLQDGQVLIAGGFPCAGPSYLFNPNDRTFRAVATLPGCHWAHTATLLADGRVLAVGGQESLYAADIFDPSTESWVPAASPNQARSKGHFATRLSNGNVLVGGGHRYDPIEEASTELY